MDDGNTFSGPLVGLRVLDLGHLVPGPFAATLLADLGADVVKVERPGAGDGLRGAGPGVSLWWKVNGRNKRCIGLDLKDATDRALFLELVERADVVIENHVPGTLERLGIGYDVLAGVNPAVILLSISGFGQTGPRATERAYGRSAEAFSGLAYVTGYADRPPLSAPIPIADYLSAMLGAFGVMAAVFERDRTSGIGQHIDMALYESALRILEQVVTLYHQTGTVTERLGGEEPAVAPAGTWRTKDGKWASFTAGSEEIVRGLFDAMGPSGLTGDPRFASNSARIEHRDVLSELVGGWMGSLILADVLALLGARGVPVVPAHDVAGVVGDDHVRAREAIVEIDDPDLGTVQMQGVVPRFSRTPGRVRYAGRPVDADRDAVLADWLPHRSTTTQGV
jgi:crotonobetainyl-CoA:carnitine CoA-transferase CaiB-like acyl-CoA transferase